MFSMNKNIAILGEIIDLLRKHGIRIDSPYDFENWIEDNASSYYFHLLATGKFSENKQKNYGNQ